MSDPTMPPAGDPNTPTTPPQTPAATPDAPNFGAPPAAPQGAPAASQAPQYGAPQAPPQGYPAPGAPGYQAGPPPQPGYGAPGAPGYGAPGAPGYGAPVAAPYAPAEEQTMSFWVHLSGIVGIIIPLILWMIGKDRGARFAEEGRESVNFQITALIGGLAVSVLMGILVFIPFVGWVLMPILSLAYWAAIVVFCVLAAMQVNKGGGYKYPINLRLIK